MIRSHPASAAYAAAGRSAAASGMCVSATTPIRVHPRVFASEVRPSGPTSDAKTFGGGDIEVDPAQAGRLVGGQLDVHDAGLAAERVRRRSGVRAQGALADDLMHVHVAEGDVVGVDRVDVVVRDRRGSARLGAPDGEPVPGDDVPPVVWTGRSALQ